MTITPATRDDAAVLLELQRLVYQTEAEIYQDWSIPPLTQTLGELLAEFDQQLFLKASDDAARLVGSVRAHIQDGTCSLGRLIVHPAFQRQGIGSTLMRHIESRFPHARCFELFTGDRSASNLSFYEHRGYVRVRQQRLSDHVSVVFLRKTVA